MQSVNYKHTTYVSSAIALLLLILNVYYFFIWRGVGLSFYIEKIFYPTKDAVLISPDYRDMVDQYEYLNQSVSAVSIVFLGDSHTKRFNVEEYFQCYNAINRGMYSDTTASLLKRLDRNVNNLNISKLFLLIGYNDLQYRSNTEVVYNIKLILNRIKAEKIYLQSILPVDSKSKDINMRIVDINEELRKHCVGKNVEYVDLHRHYLNVEGGLSEKYSVDGIHLNRSGYLLWKELIKNKMR